MVKIVLVCTALVAICCAAPQGQQQLQGAEAQQPQAQILKQDSTVGVDGYHFDFETSDGTAREEQGELKKIGEHEGISVKGSYRYVAPDGQHYAVTFLADENGFQPQEHLESAQQQQQPAQQQYFF